MLCKELGVLRALEGGEHSAKAELDKSFFMNIKKFTDSTILIFRISFLLM